jgi:hypothetical protein
MKAGEVVSLQRMKAWWAASLTKRHLYGSSSGSRSDSTSTKKMRPGPHLDKKWLASGFFRRRLLAEA